MTQQAANEQLGESTQRRSRGPSKPFPSITFEEAILLPKSILEHGLDGVIQRLTLLDELGFSPTSSKTRSLISGSLKYGLTEGSYNASSLSVTDAGRMVSGSNHLSTEVQEKKFELAIDQFSPFKSLYEKLKGNRLREGQVLHDELRHLGVSEGDCQQAAEIFTANLRSLGLVREIIGQDYIMSIDESLREVQKDADHRPTGLPVDDPTTETSTPVDGNGKTAPVTNRPALHIDIQVHIDPTSSAELIDQIFASMAKHLYGNES